MGRRAAVRAADEGAATTMIKPATRLVAGVIPFCDEHYEKHGQGNEALPPTERMDCFSCTLMADVAFDLIRTMRSKMSADEYRAFARALGANAGEIARTR